MKKGRGKREGEERGKGGVAENPQKLSKVSTCVSYMCCCILTDTGIAKIRDRLHYSLMELAVSHRSNFRE